jgi:8-oxo-dGTP pyrophosphatase MutT (NUDIX family)
MPRENGPWTILASHERFRYGNLTVREDEVVRPDGERGTYVTVRTPPGVAGLPIDDEGQVYLTRQYRYAIEQFSVEAAAGGMDDGETPVEAVRREVEEELGVRAEEWVDLGLVDVDTSVVLDQVRLFVGHGLSFTETEREGTEVMETLRVPLSTAVEMVMRGEITHAVTALLLLKAAQRPVPE